jgi:hypothetical protein
MIIGFKGRQGCGKSASMVLFADWFIRHKGYSWTDCVGNMAVYRDGYTALKNNSLRQYIGSMVEREFMHKIILIDEIDRVLPSRNFKSMEQTDALMDFLQDEKLFNIIMYTEHLGNVTDKIVRDATQVMVLPKFNKADRANDTIRLTVLNGLVQRIKYLRIYPASVIWNDKKLYNRWELIKER